MSKGLEGAPHTGTYRATEPGFHHRYYEEGDTDQFDKGDPLPHYFEPVSKPQDEIFTPNTETSITHSDVPVSEVIATEANVDTSDDEIRQLAKTLGIKSWHVKGIDKLKAEIKVAQEA
jgi:hypothetical protein